MLDTIDALMIKYTKKQVKTCLQLMIIINKYILNKLIFNFFTNI